MSIGQLAKSVGVNVETVRFYEREGLLKEPTRSASRYRQYDENARHRLRFIMRAKECGFTLREIKRLLDLYESMSATRQDVRDAADEKLEAIEAQIRELQVTRELLLRVRAMCSGDGPAQGCPILLTFAGDAGERQG